MCNEHRELIEHLQAEIADRDAIIQRQTEDLDHAHSAVADASHFVLTLKRHSQADVESCDTLIDHIAGLTSTGQPPRHPKGMT